MGTVVSFDVRPGDVSPAQVYLALAGARRVLHQADAVFSTWKQESPVSRLRRGEITLEEAPPEVATVLELCREAKTLSGGWFDPWAMPGGVDPTGLVKGWAARLALNVIMDAGASAAMVSAGGDIAVAGLPSGPGGRGWRVGVRDPWHPMRVLGIVEVPGAIGTSGGYERGDHVVDPFTGRATSAVASATVTGPDLALADALATGLLAGGDAALEAMLGIPGYEVFLIRHDQSAVVTAGFPMVDG
jgi:thiamine biosynthesis lipoprotein